MSEVLKDFHAAECPFQLMEEAAEGVVSGQVATIVCREAGITMSRVKADETTIAHTSLSTIGDWLRLLDRESEGSILAVLEYGTGLTADELGLAGRGGRSWLLTEDTDGEGACGGVCAYVPGSDGGGRPE